MEALGHIVWDVHTHEHKAFNMWVEPRVEREEVYGRGWSLHIPRPPGLVQKTENTENFKLKLGFLG